jgi:hypothetical protein
MGFLSHFLKTNKKSTSTALTTQKRDQKRYALEKEQARSANVKDRLALAKNTNTHREILYYLVEDKDEGVRRAVAANPSTPVHASSLLARDSDVDVKLSLITRLTELLPDLSQDQYSHLYAYAAQAMGILALDEFLKVRLALSTALKDALYAPPDVVKSLAQDVEREVSEPILRFCAAVPDEALLDILQNHPEPWVVEAIAARENLNAPLSEAVIETDNTKAGQALIENKTATLSTHTLDDIVRRAPEKPEWHNALALQTHLPPRIIKDIILFVDISIQKLILKRIDIDDETRHELTDTISRRMNFLIDEKGQKMTTLQKAEMMLKSGSLDDNAIRDALALREYDFIYHSFARKSGLSVDVIKKMLSIGSAKAAISATWAAGYKMRTALDIQKTISKIQPKEILYPKGGDDYPMTEKEMRWQIDFFK